MKITIEIDDTSELKKLTAFLNNFKIDTVNVIDHSNIPLTKGDKTIDPAELFGIWKTEPKNIEDIRKAAWQRK